MENIESIIKFIEFDDKESKIFTIFGYIIDFWTSWLLYKVLGGELTLLTKFDASTLITFFTSKALFIPILTLFLNWIIFHKLLSYIINVLLIFIFTILKGPKVRENIKKANFPVTEMVRSVFRLVLTYLPVNLSKQKLTSDEFSDKFKNISDELEEMREVKIARVVIYIQFLILYNYTLAGYDIFTGYLYKIINFVFILFILGNILIALSIHFFLNAYSILEESFIEFLKEEGRITPDEIANLVPRATDL